MGLGQIVYGPLSDMFGRKPPLYIGLALFAAGAIGCALAPSVRTADRLAAHSGARRLRRHVIPRAIVRDLHTGTDAARLIR